MTAHTAVTRGIERALADLGVDLVGCSPSVLSGHVIKELREAGLLPDRASDETAGRAESPQVTSLAEPAFEGHEGRECGEHRTTGGRAWCHDDSEWCYPGQPCRGCELLQLRAEVKRLRERIGEVVVMLLRGGTTDHDRRRSTYAVLTRPGDDVCGHGIPRALVDCAKCDAALHSSASVAPQTEGTAND